MDTRYVYSGLVIVTLIGVVGAAPTGKTRKPVYTQPEQVHLSYGSSPKEMTVTWVTLSKTNHSIVEYGQHGLTMVAKGSSQSFQDGGSEKRILYMHRVRITGLTPGQRYFYHCGNGYGWSDLFYFTAMKQGSNWSPRFAVYGDMGNVNAQSLGRLQEETQQGHLDAILHVGDLAYDMDTDNGRVGDAFMNQIQSIAAYVPYMTSVGNHEQKYNFSNYMNRMSMPGGDGYGMFYSFNVGPVHFVVFSSEYYYYLKYGYQQVVNQYQWMERDLQEANKQENRAVRPWIITMCHRPLYCSNSDDPPHCSTVNNVIRTGFGNYFSPEQLMYKYGVDLNFQAHEHSYERLWPVYNLTVCNGSEEEPYKNPRAPVHIVTGSAGCLEGVDPFFKIPHPWSAAHSDDYGYTKMTVVNSTHLHLEQVSDDKGGAVIDSMMLIKDKHGAGLYDCHRTQDTAHWPPITMKETWQTGNILKYTKM